MHYLDSSAIVKLVLEEPETPALRAWLGRRPSTVTSGLASVEVRRTVRFFAERALSNLPNRESTVKDLDARTDAVMSGVVVLAVDDAILSRATVLEPARMRTLDAIHLASALSLEELEGFVSYDRELGQAARDAGLIVVAPA